MPLSARELFIILRARDEASRVLRGVSRELLATGTAAQASAARAQAAAARQRLEQLKMIDASERQTLSQMRLAAAQERLNLARMRGDLHTANQLKAQRNVILGMEQQILNQRRLVSANAAQMTTALNVARSWDIRAASLERANKRSMALARSIETVGTSAATAGVGVGILGAASLAWMYSSIKVSREYERQTRLTLTQVDGFKTSLKELGDIGLEVARNIGAPFEQIQPTLYDIFSSMDVNVQESKILLKGFAKAAVAGQADIQKAARGTIAVMNAYNIPAKDVNRVLDIQFELVRKGVGTYEEFAGVFGRIVPASTRAGQKFETVAAMLAFMTRNGLSAAMAATSAARALEAMSHPKTVKRLESIGIKVRDAKGRMLPLVNVLGQLRKKLNELPPAKRVGALVDILKSAGGTIQARRFLEQVLLRKGELEDFTKLLKSMGDASGVMEDKYGEMADSAAAKTELLNNRWMALKEGVGRALMPMFLRLTDVLGDVFEAFNKLDPETKRQAVTWAAWIAAITLATGVGMILLGFLAAFIAAMTAAGTTILIVIGAFLAIGGAVAVAIVAIKKAYNESDSFRKVVERVGGKVKHVWRNVIVPAARWLKDRVIEAMDDLVEGIDQASKDILTAMDDLEAAWKRNSKEIKAFAESIGDLLYQLNQLAEWLTGSESLFTAWAELWGKLVLSISGMIAAIMDILGGLENFFGGLTDMMFANWRMILAGLTLNLDAFKNAWSDWWASLDRIARGFWGVIAGFLHLVFELTFGPAGVLGTILRLFGVDTTNWWKNIETWWKGVWKAIETAWNNFWAAMTGTAQGGVSSVIAAIFGLNVLPGIVEGIFNAMRNSIIGRLAAAMNYVTNWQGTLIGFFSGAGGWLISAGAAMIDGFISGIRARLPDVTATARGIAAAASEAFRRALKIGSPSKLFMGYGQNTIQGFVNGILKGGKTAKNAMERVVDRIWSAASSAMRRSSNDRTIRRARNRLVRMVRSIWSRRLRPRLNRLEDVQDDLKAAEKARKGLLKARDDLRKKLTESMAEGRNLFGMMFSGVFPDPAEMALRLKENLAQIRGFSANLKNLIGKGFNIEIVKQIAEQGAEAGSEWAAALATATPAQIAEINKMFKEIGSVAGDAGKDISQRMYIAGLKAADGLIAGLKRKRKSILRELRGIAKDLARAIKKALGIRSPSKVFADIAHRIGDGLLVGLRDKRQALLKAAKSYSDLMANNLRSNGVQMSTSPVGSGRFGGWRGPDDGRGPDGRGGIIQHFTIYTQELDPRKHAADLGWEIGRRVSS